MANIIITGASSGIGFETVLDLTAKKENNVIALARSADKLRRLHEISSDLNFDGGKLYPAQFDIVYDNYADSLIPFIQSKFDKVDILINNAGALINKPFLETSTEEFASMLQTEMFEAAFPDAQAGTLAFEMGRYVADFAQNGSQFYNGKILPVANTTP